MRYVRRRAVCETSNQTDSGKQAVVNQEDAFSDSHELQKVLVAIANACAEISERVAAQPTLSQSERGYTGETNESGDIQKKLEVFCDDVFEKHLIERLRVNEKSVVKAYFSEERSEKNGQEWCRQG